MIISNQTYNPEGIYARWNKQFMNTTGIPLGMHP